MNLKLITTIIFGVVFIVATIFSLVNASMLLGEGFKYALDYDDCEYYGRPVQVEGEDVDTISDEEKEEYCANNRKRKIAESSAFLVVSLPLAIWFYRKFRKE